MVCKPRSWLLIAMPKLKSNYIQCLKETLKSTVGLSREKLSRAENRQPECHWRHCCASHGPFLLLDGQDVCSKVIHRVAIEGGARFGVCPCHALVSCVPNPRLKTQLGKEIGSGKYGGRTEGSSLWAAAVVHSPRCKSPCCF